MSSQKIENFQVDILIPPGQEGTAKNGQIVVADIIAHPSERNQPLGKIVEVLGDHMAPGMEIDIAIRKYNIPYIMASGSACGN